MRTNGANRAPRCMLAGGILWLSMGIAAAKPDQPQIVNAKLETRTVAQNLETSVAQIEGEQVQPGWISYSVDAVAGNHSVCCGSDRGHNSNGSCGTCNLEKERGNSVGQRSGNRTVKLEGTEQLIVLLRIEGKRVTRIRVASKECTLDAGGLRVVWLSGVKPEESVALLKKYVEAGDFDERNGHGLSEEALTAIAFHADSSADRAFASFVAAGQSADLREKASFWLGAARGKVGLALLEKMAKSDPSAHVREQVAFALSVSQEPQALEQMIRMAHEDADTHVRGQALFWLAQKAGKKAESAIAGAIQSDPDTEVKKKAVFALSQMPKDEGVPKLIEVAQSNKNAAVRKQAMFWLGQSEDPRALAFFEKILSQ